VTGQTLSGLSSSAEEREGYLTSIPPFPVFHLDALAAFLAAPAKGPVLAGERGARSLRGASSPDGVWGCSACQPSRGGGPVAAWAA